MWLLGMLWNIALWLVQKSNVTRNIQSELNCSGWEVGSIDDQLVLLKLELVSTFS